MVSESGILWNYLSEPQRSLIREGYYLLEDSKVHTPTKPISDYSYLVFPFAKTYEGFLKQLFLDLGFIKKWQYESDHFRIGKALSPHMAKQLRQRSIYSQLVIHLGSPHLADELWRVWKRGRNLIFHYFPHNIQAVDQKEAEKIISEIMLAMEQALEELKRKNAHLVA